jgi:hypothetical protein
MIKLSKFSESVIKSLRIELIQLNYGSLSKSDGNIKSTTRYW